MLDPVESSRLRTYGPSRYYELLRAGHWGSTSAPQHRAVTLPQQVSPQTINPPSLDSIQTDVSWNEETIGSTASSKSARSVEPPELGRWIEAIIKASLSDEQIGDIVEEYYEICNGSNVYEATGFLCHQILDIVSLTDNSVMLKCFIYSAIHSSLSEWQKKQTD